MLIRAVPLKFCMDWGAGHESQGRSISVIGRESCGGRRPGNTRVLSYLPRPIFNEQDKKMTREQYFSLEMEDGISWYFPSRLVWSFHLSVSLLSCNTNAACHRVVQRGLVPEVLDKIECYAQLPLRKWLLKGSLPAWPTRLNRLGASADPHFCGSRQQGSTAAAICIHV